MDAPAPEPSPPPAPPAAAPAFVDPGAAEGLPALGATDFWEILYGRRSVRRFKQDLPPAELVERVVHAGTWAPSSCNYQMWDLVVVDDPELNRALGELSTQMANAPVNIVVSYGTGFSEEGMAGLQSASAMIQNMSLAAHALGLGTFWITAMGSAEKVRETVGLPRDRFVVAVLALGWPDYPEGKFPRAPKRRPMDEVSHENHYGGRAIPSSADPQAWESDLLGIYQRARVMNGLRHNKPRPWEVRALEESLDLLLPDGAEKRAPDAEGQAPRWLDVLPCTGILVERVSKRRPGFRFDVAERSRAVATFAGGRTRPKAGLFAWPVPAGEAAVALDEAPLPPVEAGAYDVVSCLFRLEGLPPLERERALATLASYLKPGGRLLLGLVSQRSFHDWTERLRARRGGPRGVEYVLSPDPSIGPFRAVDVAEVESAARAAGLTTTSRTGVQAVPQPEEIDFRTRNFAPRSRKLATLVGKGLATLERLPGVQARYGRFQFLLLTKA
ncbi:MAG: nitroreductase family protein [Planctomycetota bacterium]|nr:nitroreductase family protein [Planctomycetota bacterium]